MDTTPPTSTVNPLPATTTSTTFTVSVTGTDPAGSDGGPPSGIALFAIYDSEDGGPSALLATVTPTNPMTTFTGQVGDTYGSTASPPTTPATSRRLRRPPRPPARSSPRPSRPRRRSSRARTRRCWQPRDLHRDRHPGGDDHCVPTGSVQFVIDGDADALRPVDAAASPPSPRPPCSVGSHTVSADYVKVTATSKTAVPPLPAARR